MTAPIPWARTAATAAVVRRPRRCSPQPQFTGPFGGGAAYTLALLEARQRVPGPDDAQTLHGEASLAQDLGKNKTAQESRAMFEALIPENGGGTHAETVSPLTLCML